MENWPRRQDFEEFIGAYLKKRLSARLAAEKDEKTGKYEPAVWLQSAAERAGQLKAATHIIKGVNSKAAGSDFFRLPSSFSPINLLGSHALPRDFTFDVTGNAGAMDVYDFLRQVYEGRTILAWLESGRPEIRAALDPDPDRAAALSEKLLSIKREPERPATDPLAKQVYFLIAGDPTADEAFHLLAPLFPTSLVHEIHKKVRDDKFGEEAKAAESARKNNIWHGREARSYVNMAIRKLGGAKHLVVSHLNAERRGINYLFPSLPPAWFEKPIRRFKSHSLFNSFGRQAETASLIRELKNMDSAGFERPEEIEDRLNHCLTELIDKFVIYTWKLRDYPPGWTEERACLWPEEEKIWADSRYQNPADPHEEKACQAAKSKIIRRLASWLVSQVENKGTADGPAWALLVEKALNEAEFA